MTTIERERTVVEAVSTGLFIDGQWREAQGGATHGVEDPSTGGNLATSPMPAG
jgi:succinate-semialdehyde dehydrogenase/glutarate-semialdehyde dehydrogenase